MQRPTREQGVWGRTANAIWLAVIVVMLCDPGLARAAEHWQMQFFHDKNDSSLDLRDLQCPSPQRCVAAGVLDENGHARGTAVVTSDGGAHWSYVELKELPVSLFFLNDSLGWMVTANGIWQTEESGRTWKKLKGLKGVERLWFVSETHGWAVGYPKAIYETTDSGKDWVKVAAALSPPSPPEETNYTSISFADDQTGMIAGNWAPGLHEGIPVWMDPASSRRRFVQRSTALLFLTRNGGKNWDFIKGSGDGYPTRVRVMGPESGFVLFEFPGSDNPSGLFRLNLKTHVGTPVFREAARVARDFAVLPDGDAVLATVELPGKSSQVPIPGKLRMLHSRSMDTWLEIPADYRAVATRPVLSAPDASHVWVATDTGMILKLVE